MARNKITGISQRKARPLRNTPPRRMTARYTVRYPGVESKNESESGTTSGGDESEAASSGDESEAASGGGKSSDIVDWEFHQGLELVLHDLKRCSTCDEFAVHYALAKIYPDPSYYEASLSRTLAIGGAVQKRIVGCQSQLRVSKETVAQLQKTLDGVRQEIRTARAVLEGHRVKLEEVRCALEEARRDWSAASGSKSSQRPRLSRSPSPRPLKSLRRAVEGGVSILKPLMDLTHHGLIRRLTFLSMDIY
jgi:hypothetical protein